MKTNSKRFFTGQVVSKKMEKTVTVVVELSHFHPVVHKVVKTRKKFQVHDPLDRAAVGDVIRFFEGRPVSKTKYMHLDEVIASSLHQA